MQTPYLFVLCVVSLTFFSFPNNVVAQDSMDAASLPVKFDPRRDPEADLARAIEIAQESERRIILDVGGEWCSWCHKLDKLFHSNTTLRAILTKNFVVLKVNFSKENKNSEFLSRFPDINGYPHLFVLDRDGTFLHSQETGSLESGPAHDPAKVESFLRSWAPPLDVK